MNRIVTTWDGIEFGQMPLDEAESLEQEDKLQILNRQFTSGTELRYRHQFTGYTTRELRALQQPKPVAVITEVDWADYKDAYKEATGAKRATQAKVEEWMRNEGIL